MRGLVPIMIRCHRVPGLPDSGVWQLTSAWEETMAEFLPGVNTSWERIDADPLLLPYLTLLSQLADLRPATLPRQAWVRSEDLRHIDYFPVVLTCPLLSGEGLEDLSSLRQWGKQGVILTGASCSRYTLDQLGTEGSRLGEQLWAGLEDLVSQTAGSLWYEASWKQAQQIAQCLAERYWALHQERLGSPAGSVVVAQPTPPEPISLQERRTRVREARSGVSALVAKDPVAIAVRDDVIAAELMRTLLSAQHFTAYEKHAVAERYVAFPMGDLLISLQPQRGETWKDVQGMLRALGDDLVDTLCAIMALALDMHGNLHITDTVFFMVEDILQICQREKSHRAYVPGQKERIIEHLRALSHIHLTLRQPSTHAGVQNRVKSPVLHLLSSTAGQYHQDTGEVIWERQAVKLGEWAALSISMNQPVALLMRTILKYHPQRDRYAKRLGRGLLLQFFRNSYPAVSAGPQGSPALQTFGDCLTYSMQELLDLAGIVPDKNHPDVTRERIESGLERLVADDVLATYHQVIEGIPAQPTQPARIRERARGWWASYAAQHWRFTPSERLCKIHQQFRLAELHTGG